MDDETTKKIAKIKLIVSRYGRTSAHDHYGSVRGHIVILWPFEEGKPRHLSSVGISWLDAWEHLLHLIREKIKKSVRKIEAERRRSNGRG